MKRHKMWVGLSSVVLATSPAALTTAAPGPGAGERPIQIAQTKSHGGEGGGHASQAHGGEKGHSSKARPGGEAGEAVRAAAAGSEGESGEAGEGGTSARLPPILRLYRDVELIRGHLRVGNELVESGQWAEALPHFLHPQEEIYGGIARQLKSLDTPPFLTALKSLAQTVKAKNKEAYARARASVDERLGAVEKAVQAQESNWSAFALESIVEVLQTAADEYEEAIEGGTISNVVEYQDSRGFVMEADHLFESIADELARKDADAVQAIRVALNDLKAAWPALQPPASPVKDLGAVLADVSKIELQLSRFR
ncbi:hypothetical protein [Microvirga massiliensis]|uniref:hypothetical protein n=1 Tax=Microvirga massiliensis TaxID=1033741 RepID=UPI00062B929C|nr:hypothetical protein [Microvirga massiliensis]